VAGIRAKGSPSSAAPRVCSRSANRRLLVTADDRGVLKLFRFPCTAAFAPFTSARGHCRWATSCRGNQLTS
jgi:hypothetical protein